MSKAQNQARRALQRNATRIEGTSQNKRRKKVVAPAWPTSRAEVAARAAEIGLEVRKSWTRQQIIDRIRAENLRQLDAEQQRRWRRSGGVWEPAEYPAPRRSGRALSSGFETNRRRH